MYSHFNSKIATNTYDILFHDEDPINGYFEPLLCKNDPIMVSTCSKQTYIAYEQINLCIFEQQPFRAMTSVGRVPMFNNIYGEGAFETICYLLDNGYSVPCLRLIIAQTFCNAVVQNDPFAIRCIA